VTAIIKAMATVVISWFIIWLYLTGHIPPVHSSEVMVFGAIVVIGFGFSIIIS
jgi:hypothetical protein